MPRWVVTPGQNYTLNYDPNPRSQFNVESWLWVTIQRGIQTWGHNSTWNQDPGSQFNVESWPGSHFNVELWPGITIQRGIMTPGQNFTLNYDPNPGSWFNVDSWLRVKTQRGIKTWGHNSTWDKDPGSKFNGGSKFYPSEGRNTMTPCLGGSQFNIKNPLNPEHILLNQDPTGRNSMGSKFNPTPASITSREMTRLPWCCRRLRRKGLSIPKGNHRTLMLFISFLRSFLCEFLNY